MEKVNENRWYNARKTLWIYKHWNFGGFFPLHLFCAALPLNYLWVSIFIIGIIHRCHFNTPTKKKNMRRNKTEMMYLRIKDFVHSLEHFLEMHEIVLNGTQMQHKNKEKENKIRLAYSIWKDTVSDHEATCIFTIFEPQFENLENIFFPIFCILYTFSTLSLSSSLALCLSLSSPPPVRIRNAR